MRNQEFYIFYSESKDSDITKLCHKLVKTYVNPFCIDEEDQSEIMGGVKHGTELKFQSDGTFCQSSLKCLC